MRRRTTIALCAEWLTVAEASAYLKVHRTTLCAYMEDGLLPWYPMPRGKGRRVNREDVDKLLEGGSGNESE
jgi:excisionase family DNA binding protein